LSNALRFLLLPSAIIPAIEQFPFSTGQQAPKDSNVTLLLLIPF
jgi:hypothetical protein